MGSYAVGRAINLVVSCTSRKRYETAPGLRARTLDGHDLRTRLESWKQRLNTTESEKYPAQDLYMGEHWSVVREIRSKAESWQVRLWICSAGYGLIEPTTPIHSYQVTFTPGLEDSVRSSEPSGVRLWWDGVCRLKVQGDGNPRSLAALAEKYPRTPMMVALSADYLYAVESDLLEVRNRPFFREHLIIVSSGTSQDHRQWKENLVPSDGSLSRSLGGTLGSLNARVASFLLGSKLEGEPTIANFARFLRSLKAEKPPREVRAAQSDADVARFIGARLRTNPQASKSRLLEELRSAGLACEQKRFGALYIEVKQGARSEIHG